MADTMHSSHDLMVKVAIMEQKIENVYTVFGRLENAIEKIGVVATDIKQLLAVHDERIEGIHIKSETDEERIISNNKNVSDDIKQLRERIATVNEDFTRILHKAESRILDNQNELEDKVTNAQREIKNYFIQHNDRLERRVKTLENWRYILVGIFIVMGAILGFVSQNTISINSALP